MYVTRDAAESRAVFFSFGVDGGGGDAADDPRTITANSTHDAAELCSPVTSRLDSSFLHAAVLHDPFALARYAADISTPSIPPVSSSAGWW